MDRLQDAVHNVAHKLGRRDDAEEQITPAHVRNPDDTIRQPPPIRQSLSKPLPPIHGGCEPGRGQSSSARDSRLYLPSIQLRRRGNQDAPRLGRTTETHDYATNQEAEKREAGNVQGGLWSKAQQMLGLKQQEQQAVPQSGRDYDAEMVDALDTVDPEVQTLISLTNVQNSLFVPNLGKYVNRRPTFSLTSLLQDVGQKLKGDKDEPEPRPKSEQPPHPVERPVRAHRARRAASIDSKLSESRYAVLPESASLSGWTFEDKLELNDHVRHMLHSRRSKFKRAMKGFLQYISRPLGFLITLYAVLITLFGLAWVLFLIGWIHIRGRQLYIINVIDDVLVALFAIIGDGMAPFRIVDTYHMIFVAHYHHLTWSIRKKRFLPDLQDHNDLPRDMPPPQKPPKFRRRDKVLNRAARKLHVKKRWGMPKEDLEAQGEFSVLTHQQQKILDHHASKFNKSHTFYKPHETETHYAFPLRLLIAIVVLLDCHSLLQISLGTCTWAISYKVRPFALTTVILICSITCNATAGLLIWIGDKKTRKNDVLERMNRQELTQEAMEKMEKKWREEEEDESSQERLVSGR